MKVHSTLLLFVMSLPVLLATGMHAEGCSDCPDKKICNCYEWGSGNILPRPQAEFWPAFFNPYLYNCCHPCERGHAFFAGYRYSSTMKDNRIARCLFGTDELNFEGSAIPSYFPHKEGAWAADNFGLAPNYSGQLYFDPSIKNHMFDLSLRLEFGNWTPCLDRLYLNLFTSLVYSRWNLGMDKIQQTASANGIPPQYASFPPCYMATGAIKATNDLQTALSGNFPFGDMNSEWHYNKFSFDQPSKMFNVADIHMILGYDFIQRYRGHFGAFLVAVAPTGNHPSPYKVFEPIIGNGHYWEFGGGLDGHINLWNCNDMCLQFFANAYMTHLFKNNLTRTFDLQPGFNGASGAGSRFMLLKEFNESNAYAGHLIPALNFTTRDIRSSFTLQGQVTAQLIFRYCNWAFGAGYNMFARSEEHISQPSYPTREFDGKRYGVKGTSGVCTFDWQEGQVFTGAPCPLGYHASETKESRMSNGSLDATQASSTQFVDNATAQQIPTNPSEYCLTWYSPKPTEPGTPKEQVDIAMDSMANGNPAPIMVGPDASTALQSTDLDYKPIRGQITHGFFTTINYEFNDDCRCFQPWLGLGGSVEFAQNGQCKVCGTNQWNVWLNGGINF